MMVYFSLFIYLILPKLNGESTLKLADVLSTELEVVELLESYIKDSEMKTMKLRSYINTFKNVEQTMSYFELVDDPIRAYQLLKHLTIDWHNIQEIINDTQSKEIREAIEIKRKNLIMPQEEDFQTAILALLNIQKTYLLNASDLADGNFIGFQSSVRLTAHDCFYLGQQSTKLDFLNLAVEWYKLALAKAQETQLMRTEEISPFLEKALSDIKNDTAERSLKSNLNNQTSNIELVENYDALCRGETLRTSIDESNLFCCLSNRNDYYFNLMPIKVEVQNNDPLILMFHDIIYASEIEIIKESTKSMLKRSLVITKEGRKISKNRTSKSSWMFDKHHTKKTLSVINRVINRASWITGLNLLEENSAEKFQVAYYSIGGYYNTHCDYFSHQNKTPEEIDAINVKGPGNRIATLLFYLNDVQSGGATVFPYIGATIWPKKGSAAFWYNLMRNGKGNFLTAHGACPVLLGSKWIATQWIRERNQVFKRPCGLDKMD